MRKSNLILALTAVAATAPLTSVPASAQAVIPIQFDRGRSGVTVNGVIAGRQYRDYRVAVRAGQMLSVSLAPTSGSPYFNIIEPGSGDVAIFVGSRDGQTFSARTNQSGAYTIRVYQMRSQGRRGLQARFRLRVSATD